MIDYIKPIVIGLLAFVGTVIEPTLPLAGVLFFAIILDCISAFDLSRRLKKLYPKKVTGKFRSEYALKILNTFIKMYGVILLIFLMEKFIIPMHNLNLVNYATLAFCLIQLWSILENASSENGYQWAKVLQKIMINKAQRHFDINIKNNKDGDDN